MAKKDTQLSDEERDLFRKAVSDSQPIHQDKHKGFKTPQKPRVRKQEASADLKPELIGPTAESLLARLSETDWFSAQDNLLFHHQGIAPRLLTQLKRGQIQPVVRLDLHGLNSEQAVIKMQTCLQYCEANAIRQLLIIHGKGNLSRQSHPILKNVVYYWLREQANVLAFCSAIAKHGGKGALYVLLRRKKSDGK